MISNLINWRLRGTISALVIFLSLSAAPPALAGIGDSTTWPQDTDLVLSGPNITLKILAGSVSDSLIVNASSFTVTVNAGTFKVRYPDPAGYMYNDGVLPSCNYVAGNNDITVYGPKTVTFTPVAAPICYPPSGGGGGGGYATPYASLISPNGGQIMQHGVGYPVSWSSSGSGVSAVRITLSTDSGVTFVTTVVASTGNISSYNWIVPDISTTKGRLKIEALDGNSAPLASDTSDADFTIVGTTPAPVVPTPAAPSGAIPVNTTGALTSEESAAPPTDPNGSGSYSPAGADAATPTINIDKEIPPPPADKPVYCVSGTLIKSPLNTAVYYCGRDGKRYVFPNEHVFKTWFDDFSSVITITPEQLAAIQLGGNVTYKPGVRMIKITTDPKVYAVARGGVLRWVTSEAVAVRLYGVNWNRLIDDVSDAFFLNYEIGPPITEADAAAGVSF